jgi:peptidoglycan/LPS O-acetylase OafA/YrhL
MLLETLWNFALSLGLATIFAFGCHGLVEVPAQRWLRRRFAG